MRKHLWNPPTDTYSPNVGSLYPIQVYTWQNVYNNFLINHFWVNNFWINHFSVSVSCFLMCVNAHTFMRFCALSDSKLVSLRWRWIFNPIQLRGGGQICPHHHVFAFISVYFLRLFLILTPKKSPFSQELKKLEWAKPWNQETYRHFDVPEMEWAKPWNHEISISATSKWR